MRQICFPSAASCRSVIVFAGLLAAASAPASAAVIGVVSPQSGPYAIIGEQVLRGARAAAGTGDQIVAIDESCEQGSGQAVAEKLAKAGASVAIGFLCVETLSGALPKLKEAGIAAITVSVRSKILMEDAQRYGWPFLRLAPADGEEAEKLAQTILTRFQNRPIALVDDGTIYGRELMSAVRQRLETGGIKPVFTDTFRPGQEQQLALVRRLVKAGASHVIVGGDRSDVAIMARDAIADTTPLTFIGGDVMRAANRPVALTDGVLAVALPSYGDLPAAAAVTQRLRAAGQEPDGYTLPAYAAIELVHATIARATAGNIPVPQALAGLSAETVIGPVRFSASHELAENPYRLQEWRGKGFRLLEAETD
ncbi:branched-chain amino acid ABC transporter substrate-binding protein [Rhizobium sp. FY34]|uniref:branched-chain amino acid ABC transporter substrate-binding protein n=1 Tax=Rhizobium sp. FY34 TaxID=2562309 RepID=UPI0010C12B6F|nr:branched-chain amino acid ABC transporter substrate-binding protein [Rhizobium sp. FY34]